MLRGYCVGPFQLPRLSCESLSLSKRTSTRSRLTVELLPHLLEKAFVFAEISGDARLPRSFASLRYRCVCVLSWWM